MRTPRTLTARLVVTAVALVAAVSLLMIHLKKGNFRGFAEKVAA